MTTNTEQTHVVHYGIDAGSVANHNLCWTSSVNPQDLSTDLSLLADAIITCLKDGQRVTIGIDCPLFWPCPDNIQDLGKSRKGEGRRSWSAGAGATITPTGCQSVAWLLRAIKDGVDQEIVGTTDWEIFKKGEVSIFLWEAFASDKPKFITHEIDALLILNTFLEWVVGNTTPERITATNPINLAAALLRWSGLGQEVLNKECLALKIQYPDRLFESVENSIVNDIRTLIDQITKDGKMKECNR